MREKRDIFSLEGSSLRKKLVGASFFLSLKVKSLELTPNFCLSIIAPYFTSIKK